MGNIINGFDHKLHPDVVPPFNHVPKFDPNYGFSKTRREKKMIATEEELDAAKVPLDRRDYCSHVLLEYLACRHKKFPFVYQCHHEKHHYFECQNEEFLDSMKDYEREKRLLKREKRIRTKAEA